MIRLPTLLLATVLLAGPVMGAELDGTLRKIKASNTITLGYREDARPFAYTGDDGKPTGYSVDLCTRIAASVAREICPAPARSDGRSVRYGSIGRKK